MIGLAYHTIDKFLIKRYNVNRMELDNIEKEVIAKFLGKPFEELQDLFLEGSKDCIKKSTVIEVISCLYSIEVQPAGILGLKNPETNASVIIVALLNGGKYTFTFGPDASLFRIAIPMPSSFSS